MFVWVTGFHSQNREKRFKRPFPFRYTRQGISDRAFRALLRPCSNAASSNSVKLTTPLTGLVSIRAFLYEARDILFVIFVNLFAIDVIVT